MEELSIQWLLILKTICYSLTTVSSLCYAVTLTPPRMRRAGVIICAVLCALAVAGLNAYSFLVLRGTEQETLLTLLITQCKVLLFQGCVLLIARHRDGRTLFAGVTAALFAVLGQMTGNIAYLLSGSMLLGLLMGTVMLLTLEFLCVHFIRKPYRRFFETSAPIFQWLFVIPSLFYVCVFLLAYWPQSITQVPQNLPACIVVMLLVIVSYPLLFSLLSYELKAHQALQRQSLMEAYAKGLAAHNIELRQIRLRGRIVRHDLRHYTGALSALLEEGHIDEARAMLARLSENAAPAQDMVCCENIIVNSILYNLLCQAKEDGVRMELQLDVPAELGRLDSIDLAGVLANLLENALRAVEPLTADRRWISFRIKCQNEQMLVSIRNPYDGAVRIDPETGLPATTLGEGHGFGMRSIAAFMAQNPSEIDLHTEDQIFALRLLIRL